MKNIKKDIAAVNRLRVFFVMLWDWMNRQYLKCQSDLEQEWLICRESVGHFPEQQW